MERKRRAPPRVVYVVGSWGSLGGCGWVVVLCGWGGYGLVIGLFLGVSIFPLSHDLSYIHLLWTLVAFCKLFSRKVSHGFMGLFLTRYLAYQLSVISKQ